MSMQVESTDLYQPLSEPTSTTVPSRISERFTVKNLVVLGIGVSGITTAIYLLVHKKPQKVPMMIFLMTGFLHITAILACNKLGIGTLLKCIQSCK